MSKTILVLGQGGYLSPFTPLGIVKTVSIEMAADRRIFNGIDLCVFTGGSDISPDMYGAEKLLGTSPNPERDSYESLAYYACLELGIPMAGICRGMQLFTVMTGGSLVQHMKHPYHHTIHTNGGATMEVNSLHHQMCLPKTGTGEILAWAEGLSETYLGVPKQGLIVREDGIIIEPEAIYFKDIKAFGVQYHPEMLSRGATGLNFFQKKVEELLLNVE